MSILFRNAKRSLRILQYDSTVEAETLGTLQKEPHSIFSFHTYKMEAASFTRLNVLHDRVSLKGNLSSSLSPQYRSSLALFVEFSHCTSNQRVFCILLNQSDILLIVNNMLDLSPKPLTAQTAVQTNELLIYRNDGKTCTILFDRRDKFVKWQEHISEALAEVLCCDAMKPQSSGRLSAVRMNRCLNVCKLLTRDEQLLRQVKRLRSIRSKINETMKEIKDKECKLASPDIRKVKASCNFIRFVYPTVRCDPDLVFLTEQLRGGKCSTEDLDQLCHLLLHVEQEDKREFLRMVKFSAPATLENSPTTASPVSPKRASRVHSHANTSAKSREGLHNSTSNSSSNRTSTKVKRVTWDASVQSYEKRSRAASRTRSSGSRSGCSSGGRRSPNKSTTDISIPSNATLPVAPLPSTFVDLSIDVPKLALDVESQGAVAPTFTEAQPPLQVMPSLTLPPSVPVLSLPTTRSVPSPPPTAPLSQQTALQQVPPVIALDVDAPSAGRQQETMTESPTAPPPPEAAAAATNAPQICWSPSKASPVAGSNSDRSCRSPTYLTPPSTPSFSTAEGVGSHHTALVTTATPVLTVNVNGKAVQKHGIKRTDSRLGRSADLNSPAKVVQKVTPSATAVKFSWLSAVCILLLCMVACACMYVVCFGAPLSLSYSSHTYGSNGYSTVSFSLSSTAAAPPPKDSKLVSSDDDDSAAAIAAGAVHFVPLPPPLPKTARVPAVPSRVKANSPDPSPSSSAGTQQMRLLLPHQTVPGSQYSTKSAFKALGRVVSSPFRILRGILSHIGSMVGRLLFRKTPSLI